MGGRCCDRGRGTSRAAGRAAAEAAASPVGVAAQLMWRILIDHARARHAAKRGGPQFSLPSSHADRFGEQPDVDLLALHEALNHVAELDMQQSKIVELRFSGEWADA